MNPFERVLTPAPPPAHPAQKIQKNKTQRHRAWDRPLQHEIAAMIRAK
jgi:hypothetical protein